MLKDPFQDVTPPVEQVMEYPFMPYKTGPIPDREAMEKLIPELLYDQFRIPYATASFERLAEMANLGKEIEPDERIRLTVLCSLANRISRQWQRLVEFGEANLFVTFLALPDENVAVTRNRQVLVLLLGSLAEGLPRSDPAYDALGRVMYLRNGMLGDEISAAFGDVLTALNAYLNVKHHEVIYEHNKVAGHVHPDLGHRFWPDSVALDFEYAKVVESARQRFVAICQSIGSDCDSESTRARLLKFIVLGDHSRYWRGVNENHSDLLCHLDEYIPANLSELKLPADEREVRRVVVKLIADLFAPECERLRIKRLDHRLLKPKHMKEGRALLDLYIQTHGYDRARIRYAHCLAITTAMVVLMSKRSPKIKLNVLGKAGSTEQSVYQALAKWVKSGETTRPSPLSIAIQVRLCSAVSLALFVEGEDGMGPFKSVQEHAQVKQARTALFAFLPSELRRYAPSTAVEILRLYAADLRKHTLPDPLYFDDYSQSAV